MGISNLRGIKQLDIDLNLSPGVYAITGQNASGKSTLIASLASIFYRDLPKKFFISTQGDTSIIYKFDDKSLKIAPNTSMLWDYEFTPSDKINRLHINGFYEGSIIFGNRFRDTNLRAVFEAQRITVDELDAAAEFVWKNLGNILHNNENYYKQKLFRLSSQKAYNKYKFNGSPYFYQLNNGELISQFNLSTGENLLVSVLHSINYQLGNRYTSKDTYLVLLDEVELALHPSALNRLYHFLEGLSSERNLAVYFSTHSVELIRQIPAENIYFLKRHLDYTVEVQNPVSPAYATRAIYIHDGYDVLILVEDILAKNIVEWIISKENLGQKRLLHVISAGGWENVVALHSDILSSYIIKQGQTAISILDGDVESDFRERYVKKGLYGNLNVFFLPVNSAEKYLREKLVNKVDYNFYNDFGDRFFRRKSLDELLQEYGTLNGIENDKSGKRLVGLLKKELIELGRSEKEIYAFLTEYIVEREKVLATTLADRIKRIL